MLLVELQLLLLPVMCLSTAVTNVSGEFRAYKCFAADTVIAASTNTTAADRATASAELLTAAVRSCASF
jgi:hypothetical protein